MGHMEALLPPPPARLSQAIAAYDNIGLSHFILVSSRAPRFSTESDFIGYGVQALT